VDEAQGTGSYTYTMPGNALPSGVYFYKMTVNAGEQQFTQTKRMTITR
jgi:hypothetical protein